MFCREEVKFLGIIVNKEGIRPDPEKIKAILDYKTPTDRNNLQKFLGSCNFYRKFSMNHAQLMYPFRELLCEKNPWRWTDIHQKALDDIKQSFIDSVFLSHYIAGKPFYIQTDASNLGISGILYQYDEDNDQRIVSIVSRGLSKCESNYTTTKIELLALVYAIIKFRTYIYGTNFFVYTDHKALTFLMSSSYYNCRLLRWNLLLQQYSFTIQYCPGKENVVADFYSRNFPNSNQNINSDELMILSITCNILNDANSDKTELNKVFKIFAEQPLRPQLRKIKSLQIADPEIQKIRVTLQKGGICKNFKLHNEVLFQKMDSQIYWRLVIPYNLGKKLIKTVHEELAHIGIYKTTKYFEQLYFWKGMNKDIKKVIRNCDLCQRVKYNNVCMEGEYQTIIPSKPSELVTLDYYGPLPTSTGGVQHLLVVMDAFSKHVSLYPVKKATTRISLVKLIKDDFPRLGKPAAILSDNGSQFTAKAWKETLKNEGGKLVYSSIRHPQSNPTERYMRELGRFFRTYCSDKHTKWAMYVKQIEEILNLTTHHSTGYTPYEIHFNRNPKFKIQEMIEFPEAVPINDDVRIYNALQNLKANSRKRAKNQKSISKVTFQVNDLVMLRVPQMSNALDKVTKKFFHLYQGPYEISKIVAKNAYQLRDRNDKNKIIGTYNQLSLKPYNSEIV